MTPCTAEMSTSLTQDSLDDRLGNCQKLHLCLQNDMQCPMGIAVAFIKSWQLMGIMILVLAILVGVMIPSIKTLMPHSATPRRAAWP